MRTAHITDEAKLEKVRAYNRVAAKLYRQRHPEKAKANVKAWRERNRQMWAKYLSNYESANKEQRSAYRSSHLQKNHHRLTVRRYRRDYGLIGEVPPRPDVCDCCGGPPAGKYRVMQLDHCHTTNKFRGWLCYYCNLALGLVKDCPSRARELANYLEKHQ